MNIGTCFLEATYICLYVKNVSLIKPLRILDNKAYNVTKKSCLLNSITEGNLRALASDKLLFEKNIYINAERDFYDIHITKKRRVS